MDQAKLKDEGYFAVFNQIGARIELPGCSLCMGNQLRVPEGMTVFSTSTRNFDNRMGNGARVFLGSAELGAVVALDGVLPTPERYFAEYNAKVVPHADEVYPRGLQNVLSRSWAAKLAWDQFERARSGTWTQDPPTYGEQ
jgi:aconitate hydratase 2/2-methylisocitrate dehydratase